MRFLSRCCLIGIASFWSVSAFAQVLAPQFLNLQGRIIRPDQSSLTASNVEFSVQIRSAGTENCVLYEETHTLNMSGSDGQFTIKVGSGLRTGSNFKDTSSLSQVFNNAQPTISALNCAVAFTSYTPASGDSRKLRLIFDEGFGAQVLSQDLPINSVPFAMNSDLLEGKSASQFVQTSPTLEIIPGTTQTRFERIFNTDYSVLNALLNGTSSLYLKSAPTASVDHNGQKAINLADPTNAQDAATKNYADTKIGGAAADSATLSTLAVADAGKTLTWDGAKWVASPSLGFMIINDTLPASTAGQASVASTWVTRNFNTLVHNEITGATLVANQITLPAGTYLIEARAPGNSCGTHSAALYNVTDAATSIHGSTASSPPSSGTVTDSVITGTVVITAAKVFEIRHISSTGVAAGYGRSNTNAPAVSISAKITKLK